MADTTRGGLEGVVAARTGLSGIDGETGSLWLAGFPLEELAPSAHFEETVHLLWKGELPDCGKLEGIPRERLSSCSLSGQTRSLVEAAVGAGQQPIDVLRLALDSLCLEGKEPDAALLGVAPVVVAATLGGHWPGSR